MSIEKDCGWLTHQGPHWLSIDHFTKWQNIHRLLAEAVKLNESGMIHDASRYLGEYGKAEKRRINEKVLYMKRVLSPILCLVRWKIYRQSHRNVP